jgi:hydroxyacylglutathione hydrolase
MMDKITESIYFLVSRSFDSNIGFISSGDHQVLIDTGTGLYASALEESLRAVGSSIDSVTDIVLTHCHIDHIGGVIPILKESSPRIYLHKAEAEPINRGDFTRTLASTFGAELPPFKIDEMLEEGSILNFGDVELRVFHTPGHSSGSITMEVTDERILFTGDTLFPGGSFGRVDFPDGNPSKLVASLKRISEMDFDIALPGHMNAMKFNAKQSAETSYRMAKSWFKT